MATEFLLALALLPAFALMMYVRRLDKIEKEPKELIIQLLIFGALTTISAIILEEIGGIFVNALFPDENSVGHLFAEFFFVVAVAEEMGKFVVLRLRTWKNPNFNYTYDAIVYAVATSLGFAGLENILYVFLNGGVPTAIARAVTAVPAHCMFGVFMGYFYGIAKRAEFWGYPKRKYWNLFLACLVPILVHGFYDFSISVDWWGAAVLFIAFYVICIVIAFIRVRKMSHDDQPIGFYPEAKEEPPAPPKPVQPDPYAGQSRQGNPYAQDYQRPNPYTGQYQQGNPYAGQYQQGNPYTGQYQQGNPYAGQYQQGNPYAQKRPAAPQNSYDSLYRPPTAMTQPAPAPQEELPSYLPDPDVPSYTPTVPVPPADLSGGSMPELPEDVLDQADLSRFE